MNMKSILAVSALAFGATLASAQVVTLATGVSGISGTSTLNVLDTNWSVFYRPASGEGVTAAGGSIENVTPEYRRTVFTPSFSGIFLDTTGYNPVDVQSVAQAGLGAWLDPRLVTTFDNEARWIAPTSSNTVAGTLVNDGNLILDYQSNSLTTQTNRTGDYFYTIRFSLSAANLSSMDLGWATDNRSSVYVNGAFVASKGLPAVSTITSVTIAPSFFVLGTNELVVVVRNENVGIVGGVNPGASENPTGLVLLATIPEPSTYALLAGLGAIALAFIRRRK
jgi:hypothetical protein